MDKTYAQIKEADRRLVLLRILASSPEYRTNQYTLEDMLAKLGHPISEALLLTELAWLAEQGCTINQSVAGVSVISLSKRGLDVSMGRAEVPGIKRPQPE